MGTYTPLLFGESRHVETVVLLIRTETIWRESDDKDLRNAYMPVL